MHKYVINTHNLCVSTTIEETELQLKQGYKSFFGIYTILDARNQHSHF